LKILLPAGSLLPPIPFLTPYLLTRPPAIVLKGRIKEKQSPDSCYNSETHMHSNPYCNGDCTFKVIITQTLTVRGLFKYKYRNTRADFKYHKVLPGKKN
jgi:hypothetical protein